ncbi:MAG: transglycosylase SLT domain-containing protein [Mediterranea sp.]|jgi:membrane-bound lytic murein transglycosylase D|nr:transglycosylase SLT domain-containing protein [Mediterranea sp.]
MKRLVLASCYIFLTLAAAQAQHVTEASDSIPVTPNRFLVADSLSAAQDSTDVPVPPAMTYPADSLLSEWYAKNFLNAPTDCDTLTGNPVYPDSVYVERLTRMETVMEMPYNDVVRRFIDRYTGRYRKQVSFMLGASHFYMPLFEEALDAYNLPLELRYLPIIESALNPSAVSRAGASGLWQFMLYTGRLYGLESNSLVDERRDPIKATWAAAHYLKDLYDIYGDWNLVIAAYNCGPGNVNKAIRRSGGKNDYWAIYNYLPRETRGYVPAFIAANYVMTYYREHNICPMKADMPISTDTLKVTRDLHLQQIAALCNISMSELRSLNPQYKRDIIPGGTKPQTLRLPLTDVGTFIDREDSIYAYRRDELFTKRSLVAIPDSRSSYQRAVPGKGTPTVYKIRSGDNLGSIAQRYGVTVNQLRRWNGISGSNIRAGKTLNIYQQ